MICRSFPANAILWRSKLGTKLLVICLFLISSVALSEQIKTASLAAVRSLAISPDGSMAAAAVEMEDHDSHLPYLVYLFSLTDGRLLSTFRGAAREDLISSVAFSPDGKELAVGQPGTGIRIISLPSGTNLRRLDDEEGGISVNALAYSRDGKFLAACDDFRFLVWDTQTSKLLVNEPAETERRSFGLHHLAISPNADTLAATDADNYLEFNWRKNAQTVKPGHVDSFSFRPDGKMIAFIARSGPTLDDRIYFRSTATNRIVQSVLAVSGRQVFGTLAYSPDGKLLALGGGESLGLYTTAVGTIRNLYTRTGASIDFPQFTSDGKHVVFGIMNLKNRNDYEIGIWDIAANKLARTISLPPPSEK